MLDDLTRKIISSYFQNIYDLESRKSTALAVFISKIIQHGLHGKPSLVIICSVKDFLHKVANQLVKESYKAERAGRVDPRNTSKTCAVQDRQYHCDAGGIAKARNEPCGI
jgi:hypothetical protein